MDCRFILLTVLILPFTGDAQVAPRSQSPAHYPPPFVRTFLRDSVENRPTELFRKASEIQVPNTNENFGTRSLPLRSAVESPPESGKTRLPLRDAVERRIGPLEDIEELDVNLDMLDGYNDMYRKAPPPVKSPYSPVLRTEEALPFFRIDNPYQRIVDYSQLSPQGLYALRRSRQLNPQVKFEFANQNLKEKVQPVFLTRTFVNPASIDSINDDDSNESSEIDQSQNGPTVNKSPESGLTILNNNEKDHARFRISDRPSKPRVVCYVDEKAAYRKEPLAFTIQDLDPFACTHVLYAFATIDPHSHAIIPRDHEYDIVKGGYRSATGLKQVNTNLKVLISIGGDNIETSKRFSRMVATPTRRRDFIRSLIGFLEEFGFDGVDLHWTYPGYDERGGENSDRENFGALLEELRQILKPGGWQLSVAVPASRFRIEDGYDVPQVANVVDFVNLQAFDMHVERGNGIADHHAPLSRREKDRNGLDAFLNVDYAVRYWLKKGMPRYKINLGIPFYGRSFTLKNPSSSNPTSSVRDLGKPGFYTQMPGSLAYYEICDAVINESWLVMRDSVGSPSAQSGDQWVGFDDPRSIEKKMQYVKEMGLGGAAVWSLDLDDFRGLCGDRYPLLSVVRRSLSSTVPNSLPVIQGTELLSGRCDNEGLYSDPRDCAAYFVCRAGNSYRVKCRDGTMFNTALGRCEDNLTPEKCRPGVSIHVPHPSYKSSATSPVATARIEKDRKKVVCYVTNWSFYRKGEGKFVPEHLDQRLCTHVIWSFASLDPENLVPKEFDTWADIDNNLYERITSLPDVKVMLALGGWTDSNGDKYSRLVSDGSARRRFVLAVVSFLRRHRFRGLHLDWNYPVCWQSNCNKGPAGDRPNFTKLVQELKAEFDKQSPPLILAVGISGYKEVIDVAYELDKIGKDVEFLSVMTYDYHGSWERKTGHVSPLYHRQGDKYEQYNTNYTMEYLVQNGAPRHKLLMGIPFYGQSFTLPSANGQKDQGVTATGPGEPGEFTKQPGMLAYYEICHRIKNQRWTKMMDPQKVTGPYAYNGDQWVSYDDVEMIGQKTAYVTKSEFGGVVAWTVDLDDFSNRCCRETFPLLKAMNRGLGLLKDSPPAEGDCTKPPEPVTPPAPTLTTGVDTGASSTTPMSSTTWPSWEASSTKPTKTTTIKTTTMSTTKQTWWTTSSTESTTTSPWWTTSKTTTKKPTEPPKDTTTIPPPAVVMPINDPTPGPSCETGQYKPDPHNCNAYYRCVLGELKKQYCAGGLHWNKERNICDWPATAHCDDSHVSSKPSKPTTTTSKPTTTSKKPVSLPASTPEPPQSDSACVTGQYYPHEYCDQFYVCVNGQKIQQRCGPGLHWNIEKGSCDWAFRVDCKRQKTTVQLVQRFQTYYSPYVAFYQIRAVPYGACQDGTFSPFPGDCNRYLQCIWGKFEENSCAPGLHWNNVQKNCDWPEAAKCDPNIPAPGGHVESDNVIPGGAPQWTPPTTTTTTQAPSTTTVKPEPLSGYFKIVCYFTNWAWYRKGLGKYTPEHIDPNLCTHIVYGFAVLDYENLIVKAHDSWADFDNKFYERVVAYKKKGLKVSLALGGWNDSAGDKYSRLVNNPAARARFIKHVLEFLEKYDFDGLDLDWEYPKCWQVDCKKGPDSDKPAFAAFVTELHAAFEPKGLLLSAAVSPSKTVIDAGYDVPVLAKMLDWVAVMTYDFHGQWDKQTGHVAPMYYHPDDANTFFNSNYSINYWISEGVPRRKIVMGMPLYGQSFQLAKESENGLNAKAPGPGQAGEFTRAAGFLAYYEICDRVKNRGWTVVQDEKQRMGPYAYKGNQWVSFDDADMIRRKSEYIRAMDLGGGMIWALDLDDFKNRCGDGHHPLLSVIRDVLRAPGTGTVQQPVLQEMEEELTPTKSPEVTKIPEKKTESPLVVTSPKPDRPMVDTTTVTSPMVEGDFKVVCYFTNWAWYRQGGGKYTPSDIDPDLCTHIVYGFAVLDGDRLIIKPHDTWADFDNKFYEKVTALRAKGVKVLIAIGGWNDSAGDKYSRLVNNPSARRKFTAHVVDFIEKNGFDGLDLDWEYPVCWQVDCNKGPASDKSAFASWVSELREAFRPKGWLLSAAVSPAKKVIDAGYDVAALSRDLDWIAVMCYDYHGQWDKHTGHVAPMYAHPEDNDVTFNTNYTIHYWIEQGADRKKLVMGMPMYGQSFSLADNSNNGLNSPTYGGGEAGEATRARGFLSYYEICTNIRKKNWKVVRDPKGRMGPYAYLRDQWVSFDDQPMIQHKSEYIKAMGLGGGMIWALDLDDFKNICDCEEYPLLKTINRVLRGYKGPQPECMLEASTTRDTGEMSTSSPMMSRNCNGNLFLPHETDCSKYYQCNQGELMELRCPNGLEWNVDRCDWPKNGCVHSVSPVSTTLKPVNKEEIPDVPFVKPVEDPSGKKVICYFTNWAWYRQGDGKYTPEDIDYSLCTHINYGFAVLDGTTLTIKPHDSWADIDNDFYKKVAAFRKKGVKVLIAIGGWNDSLGDKYSRLVNDPQARARFVRHVSEFIEKWGFDGLDLDWEYPKCWQVDCNRGPDSDKEGFASLVRELSMEFRQKGWLLSAAVSPSKAVIDAGYDVPTLNKYFDWIAVMTYDFHGHWDKKTGHVAPLYYYPGDTYDYFNANFSLSYWIELGADPNKIIMGIPLYGQSFSLADASEKGLNSPSYGPGEAGEFTRAGGFLAFYEICERVKKRSWTVVRDPQGRIGPYAHSGNQWVSYDDVSDVVRKTKLIRELNLGGGMIWALDLDDFRNRCGCGKHPLLKALNKELRGGFPGVSLNDCT